MGPPIPFKLPDPGFQVATDLSVLLAHGPALPAPVLPGHQNQWTRGPFAFASPFPPLFASACWSIPRNWGLNSCSHPTCCLLSLGRVGGSQGLHITSFPRHVCLLLSPQVLTGLTVLQSNPSWFSIF